MKVNVGSIDVTVKVTPVLVTPPYVAVMVVCPTFIPVIVAIFLYYCVYIIYDIVTISEGFVENVTLVVTVLDAVDV